MKEGWRCINDGPMDAARNMAVDEAVAVHVMAGLSPPTLRFYGWEHPAVTIGRFQRLEGIDIDKCRRSNIKVVRRPTGGRAILHGDDLTYCFSSGISGSAHFRSLKDTYTSISKVFFHAFSALGIDIQASGRKEMGRAAGRDPHCFKAVSLGEITLKGHKIIGSAQKRYREGFMQQGSIPLTIDSELCAFIFGREIGLSGIMDLAPGFDPCRFKDTVLESVEKIFNVKLFNGPLTEAESLLARELLDGKYRSAEWTGLR